MRPTEVMGFINRYLEFAGPVVRNCGGFVEKYLGDGAMAVFPGDPVFRLLDERIEGFRRDGFPSDWDGSIKRIVK